MPDTHRQKIINALKTRLQLITVANGYNYNLGGNVVEWPKEDISQGNVTGVFFRDMLCDSDFVEMGHRHKLHIELVLNAMEADSTPIALRKMIADILKAIGVDAQWGGLALNTYPEGDTMQLERKEKIVGSVQVKFYIEFRTFEWNPYLQL